MLNEIFIKGFSSILARWMRKQTLPKIIELVKGAEVFKEEELKKIESEIVNKLCIVEKEGEEWEKQLNNIIKEIFGRFSSPKGEKE